MSLNPQDVGAAFRKSLHEHWRAFLIEGIVLTILGIAAIAVPPLAGLAVAVVVGWLFLIGGAVGLVATFNQRNAPGFWWALLSAAIAVLAGGVLLANPAHGVATLTYVLIAFFLIDGVLIIVMAFEHRRELSGRWELMMLGGVIDLILAGIIISGLPGTLEWALGLLVGIDLVFGGTSLIAMALHARKLTS
ncbi:MAG TPA: HdeD family acid-resistance protein [Stellaceae bacterium]|nr:HdeD family acid-resistance protein [Stellaceae bacterium]